MRAGKHFDKISLSILITQALFREGVQITSQLREIIIDIVTIFPSHASASWVSRWYSSKGRWIIVRKAYFVDNLKQIINEIWKEILYFLREEEFEDMKVKAEEEGIVISPQWIRNNYYSLYLSIKRGFRNENGIDYNFILNKLNYNKFNIKYNENWGDDKEKIIIALINLLEDKNPETFSPFWIDNQSYAIAHQLRKFDNWDEIVSFLPPKWKKRFTYQRIKNYANRQEVVKALVRLLEQKKPKFFSPSWIKRNECSISFQVYSLFKSNWDEFIVFLPLKWRKRWWYRGVERKRKYNEKIEEEYYRLFEKNKEKIYLLYSCPKNEIDIRDSLIEEFLLLARKGSKLARELLIESASSTIYGDASITPKVKYSGLLKNRIDRCIANYNFSKGLSFLIYVINSLKLETTNIKEFSLNAVHNGFREEAINYFQAPSE